MPNIGQEITVTLRIYKEKDGLFSNNKFYAAITDKEKSAEIRELLKKHSGMNHHHLSVNIT